MPLSLLEGLYKQTIHASACDSSVVVNGIKKPRNKVSILPKRAISSVRTTYVLWRCRNTHKLEPFTVFKDPTFYPVTSSYWQKWGNGECSKENSNWIHKKLAMTSFVLRSSQRLTMGVLFYFFLHFLCRFATSHLIFKDRKVPRREKSEPKIYLHDRIKTTKKVLS